jgi:hypothetical protein
MDVMIHRFIPLFFYLSSVVALFFYSGMEDPLDILIASATILVAIATAVAAISASKSAKAARDSADQWREQKKYDLEVNSLLEALQAVNHWSDMLIQGRYIQNPSDVSKLISIFVNQSENRCIRYEKRHDAIANAWIKARAAINKAEHLGFYEETSVIDLCKINEKYSNASSSTLYAMHKPHQNSSFYNSDSVSIAFQTKQDTFESTYLLTIANFTLRYKDYYNKLTNI